MARLALRVPWGVVVAVLFISCTPATDEPSPTATPTATAAATATATAAATATAMPAATATAMPAATATATAAATATAMPAATATAMPAATATAMPAATATAMPAATATPIVTPTPVPPPVTSDTWPELSLDATISPSCRAQIIDYAEFSGTLAEIAQQEAALSALFGYQFSRLTDRQLRDIDSRLERLGYELEYQGVWNYGVYAGVYATPTPRPTPTQGATPTPGATPNAVAQRAGPYLAPTPTATPAVDFKCARDREALNQFLQVRRANPMGQFRQGVLEDYWRCAAYRDDLPPTPDVSQETYCRQGQAWWPESWLPNG